MPHSGTASWPLQLVIVLLVNDLAVHAGETEDHGYARNNAQQKRSGQEWARPRFNSRKLGRAWMDMHNRLVSI